MEDLSAESLGDLDGTVRGTGIDDDNLIEKSRITIEKREKIKLLIFDCHAERKIIFFFIFIKNKRRRDKMIIADRRDVTGIRIRVKSGIKLMFGRANIRRIISVMLKPNAKVDDIMRSKGWTLKGAIIFATDTAGM